MKVGIIRCQQTEDICGGNACIRFAAKGKGAFQGIGPVEIFGMISCGGCPGKKIIQRAKMLMEKGAEVIALSSCISKGTPIGFPCPHFEQIKRSLATQAELMKEVVDIEILDWTHN
jgi:predicted metal-binding protein